MRREDFLGPGPWQILRLSELGRGYEQTPDDDPRHLYDNVLVALDAGRNLNNGEPAALLRWLDELALAPGERVLHVGCGVGYYTAIAAAAVPAGSVVGVELDPRLAELARRNLARTPNATVVSGDGSVARRRALRRDLRERRRHRAAGRRGSTRSRAAGGCSCP